MNTTTTKIAGEAMTDEQEIELRALVLEYGLAAVIEGDQDRPRQLKRVVDYVHAMLAASTAPAQSCGEDAASDLAFSVYSGLNALRWLLNLTTEFDRKDVRTRQAARLLDDYTDRFGKTNRQRLEDLWKKLNDKLPDDGRINEYLRAHDAASRELAARAKDSK
jgi:hypothetical protein